MLSTVAEIILLVLKVDVKDPVLFFVLIKQL